MDLHERVARIVVERLELEDFTAATLPRDALLFGPAQVGGLELDSIAALEIVAGLSEAFDHPFEDLARDDLMTIDAVVDYIRRNGLEPTDAR